MTIAGRQLIDAIRELELTDRPVMVHSSLGSFGDRVENGADGLLDCLLSCGCTVLVPTFSELQFEVLPPASMRPARNGIDYTTLPEGPASGLAGPLFTPASGAVNPRMGAFPAALIARGGRRRGAHPLNSFAAAGPRAAELVAAQSPTDVYGPVRKLIALEGTVLLIGVGLNRMTALHLAEQRSGRRLFIRWARTAEGRAAMVEVGSCSEGFPRLGPVLRPHLRTARIGASRWAAYPARAALNAAVAAITADQEITRCSNAGCPACADSIAGGPLGPAPLG